MNLFIKNLPNTLTIIRIICASVLLLVSINSTAFIIIYLCCGLTDILDGFFARKFKATSKFGAALDSFADAAFFAVLLVKLLRYFGFPIWVWIWCGIIAIIKFISLISNYTINKRLSFLSNWSNKVAGFTLYITPLCLLKDTTYCTPIIVGIVVTCAAINECIAINIQSFQE